MKKIFLYTAIIISGLSILIVFGLIYNIWMKDLSIKIPNPDNFEIIASCSGDLDFDGKKELVVVYNTPNSNAWGKQRVIRIFKTEGEGIFKFWKESFSALRRSEENGIKDNQISIIIENGELKISCTQIEKWRLEETNVYRYKDDQFILKEYYSHYGKDCAYWIDVFYNSENGELIFKKEYDNCDKLQENQKTEIEKLNLGQLNLTLMNRTNEYIEVTTPIFQYNWEF